MGAKITKPNWTASQLVLRGTFCPSAEIRDYLNDLREAYSLDKIISIAFDRATILKQLTFVSSNSDDWKPTGRSYEAFYATRFSNFNTPSVRSTDALRHFLKENTPLGQVELQFTRQQILANRSAQAVNLVLLARMPALLQVTEDELETLATMVNGTIIANARRDQRINRLIAAGGTRPHKHRNVWGAQLGKILELAVSATGATAAVYYHIDAETTSLKLATPFKQEHMNWLPAQVPITSDPARQNATHPRPVDRFSEALVQAFRATTAVVYPPYKPGANSVSQKEVTPGDGFQIAFLCAPVTHSPLGQSTVNHGVAVVIRDDIDQPDDTTFTSFDLAFLRNICLRISLLVTLVRIDSAAALIEQYSNIYTRTFSTDRPYQQGDHQRSISTPMDRALPALRQLLSAMKDATRSSSASFRALELQAASPNTLVLKRKVIVPDARRHDLYTDIAIHGTTDGQLNYQNSTNAYAAHTGRIVHLYDRSKTDLISQCPGLHNSLDVDGRPNAGSSLTLPVRVDGMIAGTINLESPLEHTYVQQVEMCTAYAGMAGLIIAGARANVVRDLALSAAQLSYGQHEASKVQALLDQLATDFPPSAGIAEKIAAIALKQSAHQAPHADPTTRRASGEKVKSLAEIVHDCKTQRSFTGLDVVIATELAVTAPAAAAFRRACLEIMENQQGHSDHDYDRASVVASVITLEARRFAAVTFRNRAGTRVNAELLESAYQVPIYKATDTLPHLGCFTAGEAMRKAGGAIFMTRGREKFVHSVILVPLGEDQ